MGKNTCVFPGETVSFTPDHNFEEGQYVALEPRTLSKSYPNNLWPDPQILRVWNGSVHLTNSSKDPLVLYKNDQVCQKRACKVVEHQ